MSYIKYAVFFAALSLASASALAERWSYSSGADGVTWTLTKASDAGSVSYICLPIDSNRSLFSINTQVTSPPSLDGSAYAVVVYINSLNEVDRINVRAAQVGARQFYIQDQDAERVLKVMRDMSSAQGILFALYRSDNNELIGEYHRIVLGNFNQMWGRHMRVCAPSDVNPLAF